MPGVRLYFNHNGAPVSFTAADEKEADKLRNFYKEIRGLREIDQEEYQEMRRAQKEGSRRRKEG